MLPNLANTVGYLTCILGVGRAQAQLIPKEGSSSSLAQLEMALLKIDSMLLVLSLAQLEICGLEISTSLFQAKLEAGSNQA